MTDGPELPAMPPVLGWGPPAPPPGSAPPVAPPGWPPPTPPSWQQQFPPTVPLSLPVPPNQPPKSGARHGAPRNHAGRNATIAVAVGMVLAVVAVATTGVGVLRHRHGAATASASASPGLSAAAGAPAASAAPGSVASSAAASAPADAVTADSPVTTTSGTQVFADDFHDPSSGWLTGPHAMQGTGEGVTDSYTAQGYQVAAIGPYHYFSYVPYTEPLAQIAMTVTATQQPGAPTTGGFGATCVRGLGTPDEIRYEFLVNETAHWFVERRDGVPSADTAPSILRQGTSPATPGAKPVTVVAVCATLADPTMTRLVVFVNGTKVADLLDVAAADDSGWVGALLASGGKGAVTTLDVSQVSESNLGGQVGRLGQADQPDPGLQAGSTT